MSRTGWLTQASLLVGLLASSIAVEAANMWCIGTVTNAYLDSSNNVIIKGTWRNDYTRVCATDGGTGVETVTCSLWLSIVISAMNNGKSVKLMYDDQGGALTCSTLPLYSSSPVPSYIMLIG